MFAKRVLILTALSLFAPPATAQQITGRIIDPSGGTAVVGAFIRLLDDDGVFLRGVLSDSAGRFVLRAEAPGRYRIRAERIGQASVDAGPFDLLAGATVDVRLESGTRAIALEGLQVSGERRCTTRPDRAASAARVWEEARKALELTLWARDNVELGYRSTVIRRELGPRLDVRSENLRPVTTAGEKSFLTTPPEELAVHGFARAFGDSIEYFGLDAEMLLSDWFLDTHCFTLVEGEEARVGLQFRPVRDSARPDVEGTLWIDRATGELRWLDYTYVRMEVVQPQLTRVVQPSDPRVPAVGMSGRTAFRRLPGGVWIVDDWWIRAPMLTRQGSEIHLAGWSLRGGVVLEAWQRSP